MTFEFATAGRILFGRGQSQRIPALARLVHRRCAPCRWRAILLRNGARGYPLQIEPGRCMSVMQACLLRRGLSAAYPVIQVRFRREPPREPA